MTAAKTDAAPGLHTTLAMTVRQLRKHRGLRQADLATMLGWPLSRVTRVEAGEALVKLVDLPALCRTFEVPLTALLAGADPAELEPLGLLEEAAAYSS